VPWLAPRLIKTALTLPDMENFFDRWTHYAGHAVIDPPTPGQGRDGPLAPDQAILPMCPPRRQACRQLSSRMTILSDGRVALCDQDWLGQGVLGDARREPLSAIWTGAQSLRQQHAEEKWTDLPLCRACRQWHRP
jgi:radical SAM protein with 4Fe4S-binding SPASM domain